VEKDNKAELIKQLSSSELLFTMPCFVCEHLERCGIGQDHTPMECSCLTDFLDNDLGKKKNEPQEKT
jgi:hypothetical protein